MTPQEIQRTMDFILRSQADAVIRMERWDERSDKQQQKIDDVIVALREAAKSIREHNKKIQSLEKSERHTARRVDGMRDVMRILSRLEARQANHLDQLEKNNR